MLCFFHVPHAYVDVQNFVHEGEGLPDPHMAGICNLLQLRGNEQLKSMYTRPLMAWVIIQVVRDSLVFLCCLLVCQLTLHLNSKVKLLEQTNSNMSSFHN